GWAFALLVAIRMAVPKPLSRRFHAPLRPAYARVLADDHAAQLLPLALAIGVLAEQQAHDGAVSADVRGGDVQVWPDQGLEPVHVPEGERLQLLGAERLGVDLDAALAPAERNVRDGGLPRHLRGQHLEQIEGDVLVVPGSPLVRA